jgi:hypothetical protein
MAKIDRGIDVFLRLAKLQSSCGDGALLVLRAVFKTVVG